MTTNSEKLISDEYEIQHFGFSSTDFITQFRISSINRIKSLNADMESTLTKRLKLDDLEQILLHDQTENLSDIQIKNFETFLKNFEVHIKKFFEIPHNVVLSEDIIHLNDNSDDIENLKQEVTKLSKKYQNDKAAIMLLNEEMDYLKKFEPLEETATYLTNIIKNETEVTQLVKKVPKVTKVIKKIQERIKENDD